MIFSHNILLLYNNIMTYNNFYAKYMKYNSKVSHYINLIGGGKKELSDDEITTYIHKMKQSVAADRAIINIIKRRLLTDPITDSDINNSNPSIIALLNGSTQTVEDTEDYLLIIDLPKTVFDVNILMAKLIGENENLYKKCANYIKKYMNKYENTNIYVVIGGGHNYDFYFPEFIKNDMEQNVIIEYVIIIFGYDYNNTASLNYSYDKVKKIVLNVHKNNPTISDRIHFAHIHTTFPLPIYTNSFYDMLNILHIPEHKNICYLGINYCGLLFEGVRGPSFFELYKDKNINYVFIGCDGLFYKNNKIDIPKEKFTDSDKFEDDKLIGYNYKQHITLHMINSITIHI